MQIAKGDINIVAFAYQRLKCCFCRTSANMEINNTHEIVFIKKIAVTLSTITLNNEIFISGERAKKMLRCLLENYDLNFSKSAC